MHEDPIAFTFFNQIGIIDQRASTLFARSLPKGMTIAQFGVLNHFVRLDIVEKSPTELARTFQVTRGTMTSTLGRMHRAELIAIRPDHRDGRGKLVGLTEKGREMRHSCVKSIEFLAPMLDDIVPPQDLNRVMPLLSRILARLESMAQ